MLAAAGSAALLAVNGRLEQRGCRDTAHARCDYEEGALLCRLTTDGTKALAVLDLGLC